MSGVRIWARPPAHLGEDLWALRAELEAASVRIGRRLSAPRPGWTRRMLELTGRHVGWVHVRSHERDAWDHRRPGAHQLEQLLWRIRRALVEAQLENLPADERVAIRRRIEGTLLTWRQALGDFS